MVLEILNNRESWTINARLTEEKNEESGARTGWGVKSFAQHLLKLWYNVWRYLAYKLPFIRVFEATLKHLSLKYIINVFLSI